MRSFWTLQTNEPTLWSFVKHRSKTSVCISHVHTDLLPGRVVSNLLAARPRLYGGKCPLKKGYKLGSERRHRSNSPSARLAVRKAEAALSKYCGSSEKVRSYCYRTGSWIKRGTSVFSTAERATETVLSLSRSVRCISLRWKFLIDNFGELIVFEKYTLLICSGFVWMALLMMAIYWEASVSWKLWFKGFSSSGRDYRQYYIHILNFKRFIEVVRRRVIPR